jgi:hypothetical protein
LDDLRARAATIARSFCIEKGRKSKFAPAKELSLNDAVLEPVSDPSHQLDRAVSAKELSGVASFIAESEELFRKKYFSNLPPGIDPDKGDVIGLPKRDQLLLEVLRWRDDFTHEQYNRPRLMQDAKELMFDLIAYVDIDRFMYAVWGEVPADSPILEEIEAGRKKSVIRELTQLLRGLISQNAFMRPRRASGE